MTVDFTARHGVSLEFLDTVEVVQANQGNAETLLTMLELWDPTGPDGPWWGQRPAAEFLQRALVAALADPGTPTPGYDDARWHVVGSSAGHVAMRMAELADLARAATAVAPDAVITWS